MSAIPRGESSNSHRPTLRLVQVEAAYWTDVGSKEHLRWAMPHDEDQHLRLDAVDSPPQHRLPWDRRHIGSGALEAAYVAAGILESGYNTGPRIWDIAAGALLVEAGGRHIWAAGEGHWTRLTSFGETEEELVSWRRPVLLASDEAYARIIA